MLNLSAIIKVLTDGLSDRQKEVLNKRFCLDGKGGSLTLAALGGKYGVTRERIRQIEAAALQDVRKRIGSEPVKSILAAVHKKVEKDGGLSAESSIISLLKESFGFTLNADQLHFILEAERKLSFYPDDKEFHSFWYVDDMSLQNAKAAISNTYKSFSLAKENVLEKNSYDELSSQDKNHLVISKKFGFNAYGDFGLNDWPEVNPKTVRDRAYLVLKKFGKPVHFKEIATLIQQKKFDEKKVHASTVHNELIKDARFVLVGRGVYALTDQGFEPGTTKEVIERILKNNGALNSGEIVKLVRSERQFKENTILLNLQNKKHFTRASDGRYKLNEA
ncbi:MAG: hypothetical protein HYT12_04325 [Candidatus Liptonbacteria bacterium]|nr:hypothetical protein [Candidatus Liptonbacteria bacterium]